MSLSFRWHPYSQVGAPSNTARNTIPRQNQTINLHTTTYVHDDSFCAEQYEMATCGPPTTPIPPPLPRLTTVARFCWRQLQYVTSIFHYAMMCEGVHHTADRKPQKVSHAPDSPAVRILRSAARTCLPDVSPLAAHTRNGTEGVMVKVGGQSGERDRHVARHFTVVLLFSSIEFHY